MLRAILTFSLCLLVGSTLADTLPTLQLEHRSERVELGGRWAFVRGEFVALPDILAYNWNIITLPAYLDAQQAPDPATPDLQRFGTYALRIQGLTDVFAQPILDLRGASDAFEIWWIERDESPILLNQTGRVAAQLETFRASHRLNLIPLPSDSVDGVLVIYNSAFLTPRSGLIGSYAILEQDDARASVLFNLALRSITTGFGLLIILQNLFFYSRRRDPVPLLLAVFTAIVILRSILASQYIGFFLRDLSLNPILIRMEYLTALWASVAILHYVTASFFPRRLGITIKTTYALLTLFALLVFSLPMYTVSSGLWAIQAGIVLFAAMTIALLVQSTVRKAPNIGLFLWSASPLALAMLHDIYSSMQPDYDVLIAEYALFLFLLFQSLIATRQFVDALHISDHLNETLQAEVDAKTAELQATNDELIRLNVRLNRRHRQVKLKAEIDHLTGLFNRATFDEHANELFIQSQNTERPLCIILLDIDHFKKVNDTHGHLIGDECLVHVASLLRGYQFRRGDVVARFGGEEFVIALDDATLDHGVKIANWLCKELPKNPAASVDSEEIHISASFGVSDLDSTNAQSLNDLINAADQALYRAKANGRNRVERA
jgi:diguanylate cyclase (GGDEF)-like protein